MITENSHQSPLARLGRLVPKQLRPYLFAEDIVFCPIDKQITSVLDVGCGRGENIRLIKQRGNRIYCVGADVFKPYLSEAKGTCMYDDNLVADARYLPFRKKTFDAVLLIELIEHLPKVAGVELLDRAEDIGMRVVIVLTPVGFLRQESRDVNVWQIHKSGWLPKEFAERGYHVKGLNGFYALRSKYANIRQHGLLGRVALILSYITQLLVYFCPGLAFHILCVKRTNTGRSEPDA